MGWSFGLRVSGFGFQVSGFEFPLLALYLLRAAFRFLLFTFLLSTFYFHFQLFAYHFLLLCICTRLFLEGCGFFRYIFFTATHFCSNLVFTLSLQRFAHFFWLPFLKKYFWMLGVVSRSETPVIPDSTCNGKRVIRYPAGGTLYERCRPKIHCSPDGMPDHASCHSHVPSGMTVLIENVAVTGIENVVTSTSISVPTSFVALDK
jgi:hypothetical protein